MKIAYFKSTIGLLKISATETEIKSIEFKDEVDETANENEILLKCKTQLEEYFNGNRISFDLEINPEGTEFQKRVWNKLIEIPFGKTISYMELAEKLGDAKSIRAAGTANGKNPIPIIIPCHRVIGSDGKLVGYAGGVWRKEILLKHEESYLTLF